MRRSKIRSSVSERGRRRRGRRRPASSRRAARGGESKQVVLSMTAGIDPPSRCRRLDLRRVKRIINFRGHQIGRLVELINYNVREEAARDQGAARGRQGNGRVTVLAVGVSRTIR